MDDIFERAETRRERAQNIIRELGLIERWSRFGNPVVVGAVRYGLVVARDIDMEIYTDVPHIGDGFAVLSEVAHMTGVRQVTFMNELDGPDMGLYWQIRYRDNHGDEWKVDNWLVAHDHPDAHWCERFAEALENTLSDESRRRILTIKESLDGETGIRGIDVYRAVMEGGVGTVTEFRQWFETNKWDGMCKWLPES